jgi:putative DNA primase/helicase
LYPNPTQSTTEAEDLLSQYADEGIKLLRLHPETKRPVGERWQEKVTPLEEVAAWVQKGNPVGWQVGEVSRWISVVDCDWPEAVRLAPRFLPATLTIHKGNEKPSLWVYRSPGAGFARFTALDTSEVLCLKASNTGAGHQVVAPPSVHVEKGAYEFTGGWNPAAIAEIQPDDLRRSCRKLATAALISRHLPENGRHHLSLAYAGFMLRNGESVEDVTEILVAAWEDRDAPREGVNSLRRNVADTAHKIADDEPATGGRTLEVSIPGMPDRVAKFMGWKRPELREGRRSYLRTDLGNAERFVDACRGEAMWCGARKRWLVWDGTRWLWDDCKRVVRLAHGVARSIFGDAQHTEDQEEQKKIAYWALTSQGESRINAMISQAAPYLTVRMEELDADPWVLNCQNGTLDLKTGALREHNPQDLITKIVPVEYNPAAPRPRFEQFLREALVDGDVISFVKRFSGYTLTGVTRERAMAILYGYGKNGKSTLIELLQKALGDYSTNTDVETLLMKRGGGVPNDVAALKGARFVSAAEVERGRRLAESKVKQLTGSDTVTARFLHGEFFDFKPEFKLWLSTNNKPEIRGTDDAIWDRIKLIPFTQRFEGDREDPNLPETLRGELAGVLAWVVEGCLEWQEHGLEAPTAVTTATEKYRSEMDTLAAFLEETCVRAPRAEVPATPLYNRYKTWGDATGEPVESQKAFGARLAERGFESFMFTAGAHKGKKGWRGIGFRVDDPDPDGDKKHTLDVEKPPEKEVDGLLEASRVDDRLPGESGLDMRNGRVGGEEVDDGRPENNKNHPTQPRVGENMELRSTSSTSSTAAPHHAHEGSPDLSSPSFPPPTEVPVSYDLKPGESSTVKELRKKRGLTEEEARRVQKLISEGMSAKWARAEILGEEPQKETSSASSGDEANQRKDY